MKPPRDIVLVSIQAILLSIYLFRLPEVDMHFDSTIRYSGLAVSVLGGIIIIYAIITLNNNLTAFPTPKSNGVLITRGLYKYIRHPIYTGILLLTSGYGTYSENTLRLCVSVGLLILFLYKARYEESLLRNKFPEYGNYIKQSGMFLPKIF
ncbi:MAG: isoprenylcysteine carboxylmethyltransferase family protein [Chitinophagaceae bacterium]|nr:isoprenylcysteine carboxylmethyltransferase family protein [Chitinophagaceae bacterium]